MGNGGRRVSRTVPVSSTTNLGAPHSRLKGAVVFGDVLETGKGLYTDQFT